MRLTMTMIMRLMMIETMKIVMRLAVDGKLWQIRTVVL